MKKYSFILRPAGKRLVIIVFVILILIYGFGRRFIYYPQHLSSERIEYINKAYVNVENVRIITSDKISLAGWFINNSRNNRIPTIIYFGGNAEEISWLIDYFEQFKDFNVCLINYRGYGLSSGSPSESKLLNDGLQIYDYVISRGDVDPNKVFVIGKSLGSGVAVYLASKRNVSKLVLSTPYDSMASVAKDHFGFLGMLVPDRFNSLKYIRKVSCKILVIAAQNDTVIPVYHAKKLYASINGDKELKIIENVGHNDIVGVNTYWEYIYEFLK